MFGWLRKRLGGVTIDGQRYGYRELVELGESERAALARAALVSGDETATRWVVEAMGESGFFDLDTAVAILADGPAHLTPDVLADLAVTLAAALPAQAEAAHRAQLARAMLALAEHGEGALALDAARRVVGEALPALANLPAVPGEMAGVLIDAAVLARRHQWSSAVLGLLDRRIDFSDADQARRAELLVAAALGGSDRAVEHLRRSAEASPDDLECHFLLGQAHATRAKKAGSQAEFDRERGESLQHLEKARELASRVDSQGTSFSGVVLGAGSALALLALMAPVFDEIMYLDGPLKGAAASAAGGAPAE